MLPAHHPGISLYACQFASGGSAHRGGGLTFGASKLRTQTVWRFTIDLRKGAAVLKSCCEGCMVIGPDFWVEVVKLSAAALVLTKCLIDLLPQKKSRDLEF